MNKNTAILLTTTVIVAVIFLFRKKINKLAMFDLIMNVILKHEGGYVNDPDDAGGETKYGISKLNFPNEDIKNLTKERAIELYRINYYIPMEIDKITDINLALNYMDMGVNAGIGNAKKIMAKALEANNKTGENIVYAYKRFRVEYYKEVAKRRNNQKYLAGWLNRVKTSNIT